MNREDITRMAREAGLGFLFEDHLLVHDELERFAALVLANNPPQSSMAWQEGYAAGAAAELRRLEAVNAQLLDSVQVAVDSDLGRLWVWPETAQETWMKNARAAIKAAKGEA